MPNARVAALSGVEWSGYGGGCGRSAGGRIDGRYSQLDHSLHGQTCGRILSLAAERTVCWKSDTCVLQRECSGYCVLCTNECVCSAFGCVIRVNGGRDKTRPGQQHVVVAAPYRARPTQWLVSV